MGPMGADRIMPIDRHAIISEMNVAKAEGFFDLNRKITKKLCCGQQYTHFLWVKCDFLGQ